MHTTYAQVNSIGGDVDECATQSKDTSVHGLCGVDEEYVDTIEANHGHALIACSRNTQTNTHLCTTLKPVFSSTMVSTSPSLPFYFFNFFARSISVRCKQRACACVFDEWITVFFGSGNTINIPIFSSSIRTCLKMASTGGVVLPRRN